MLESLLGANEMQITQRIAGGELRSFLGGRKESNFHNILKGVLQQLLASRV